MRPINILAALSSIWHAVTDLPKAVSSALSPSPTPKTETLAFFQHSDDTVYPASSVLTDPPSSVFPLTAPVLTAQNTSVTCWDSFKDVSVKPFFKEDNDAKISEALDALASLPSNSLNENLLLALAKADGLKKCYLGDDENDYTSIRLLPEGLKILSKFFTEKNNLPLAGLFSELYQETTKYDDPLITITEQSPDRPALVSDFHVHHSGIQDHYPPPQTFICLSVAKDSSKKPPGTIFASSGTLETFNGTSHHEDFLEGSLLTEQSVLSFFEKNYPKINKKDRLMLTKKIVNFEKNLESKMMQLMQLMHSDPSKLPPSIVKIVQPFVESGNGQIRFKISQGTLRAVADKFIQDGKPPRLSDIADALEDLSSFIPDPGSQCDLHNQVLVTGTNKDANIPHKAPPSEGVKFKLVFVIEDGGKKEQKDIKSDPYLWDYVRDQIKTLKTEARALMIA